MESNATVKGLIFLGVKTLFAENKTPKEFEKFVLAFPESEQEVWTGNNLLPISRIPASVYIHMYEVICAQYDDPFFQQLAAAVAFNDLGTVMRIFVKLGIPAFTANLFSNAYKHYFNVGELDRINVTLHTAEFELVGADPYGEAGCSGTLGWTRMALEYAGAKELQAEHTDCRYHGSQRCLFRYNWK